MAKCPLFKMKIDLIQDCLEEQCAWWDNITNKCSIKIISEAIFNIEL